MDQITIRQTTADLPRFDEESDLEPVSRLGAESRLVADFQFGGVIVPPLDLAGAHLLRGKIHALNAGQAGRGTPAWRPARAAALVASA